MTWFRNLRTIAKLMMSFGLMALLMGVVGYEGLSGIGTINNEMAITYQRDLTGIVAIEQLSTNVALIGRNVRNVILAADRGVMERDKLQVDSLYQQIDEEVARCEKTFVTEQGRAALAKVKESLPEFKSVVSEVMRDAIDNDRKAAIEALAKAQPIADRTIKATNEAAAQKEGFAKERFEASGKLYDRSEATMLVLVFGSIALALTLGFLIARLISGPLAKTVAVLEGVAAGDLTRSLDVTTSDEVGKMAKALNAAVEGMREALIEVRGSADGMAASSQQLAASSEELSSGAQEQASGLEETSASLEQITTSVRQNADSAKQANQLAAAARDTADKGRQVVSSAVSAMGEINTSSKKISDIITAIDEIAFQTNLLALNAAVEAARAGEQGRGFAVVAAEVRSLAQRSATAAKEIKALIQDSVRKVETGSEMVNQSGEVLVEIVSSVKRVTDIVGEIAAASREQATGVEQVSKAMVQMDQVTQQNSAQTEELSATAQSLAASADQLQGLVARFTLEHSRNGRVAARTQSTGARVPHPPAKAGKASAVPKSLSKSLHNLSRNVAPAGSPTPLDELPEPASAAEPGAGGGFTSF